MHKSCTGQMYPDGKWRWVQIVQYCQAMEKSMFHAAGLLALGHMHGVNTGVAGEPDDLATAKDLMRTCYEMYARTPAGLAPEIVHFVARDGDAGGGFPKQHEHDVGGGDFTVKPLVALFSSARLGLLIRTMAY